MSLTPTKRFVNWSSVSFTPGGGTATPIAGIKRCSYNEGIQILKESADFDLFPTVSVAPYMDPTFTIETIEADALLAVLAGVRGALTATLRDAYNFAAVGGGAKVFAFSNAQIQDRSLDAAYREFARESLTFGCISPDGVTHPVSVTAA